MDGMQELRSVLTPTIKGYEKDVVSLDCFREVDLPIVVRSDGGILKMEENAPDAKLQKVYLVDLDPSGLVLKPDNFGVRFFRRGCWNKAVDYLVFTRHNNTNYAIFIDLKSSLNDKPDRSDNLLVVDSGEDAKKESQFFGAAALFCYLKQIVKKATGDTSLDNFKIRNWILYEDVKTRSPSQSIIMSTAHVRKKSALVVTKQVADASTLSVLKLM